MAATFICNTQSRFRFCSVDFTPMHGHFESALGSEHVLSSAYEYSAVVVLLC